MAEETEIWKEYRTIRSYVKISNFGNVDVIKWNGKKAKTENVVKIIKGRRCLGNNMYAIFRLVDFLFRGPLPEGYDVHHKDFNKLNDRLDNLERLTNAEHLSIHAKNRDPWNKGLTKDVDERLTKSEDTKKKISDKLKGNTNTPKGRIPWNKGLTKETDERVANNYKKRNSKQ